MANSSMTKTFHLFVNNYLPLLSSFHYEIINTELAGHVTDFQFKMPLLGTYSLCFLLGH